MAKKKAAEQANPRLFEQHERALDRRIRRQRALFIPKYIVEAAANQQLSGAAQDKAYAIAVRWADLETSGHLAKHKETSIDTQFLDQLFGEGLGYSVKTQSPKGWQLEHKFTVPGIGTADAALGDFPGAKSPTVVVELKDANNDIDRDKSNGRTAVQQCWDYLNALPECPWGIVSNFSTIRLYHRSKGNLAYEEFTLQELRDRGRFNEFYALFERGGLLRSSLGQAPRAAALLEKTQKRQKDVGDDLYKSYQFQRLRLIEHLNKVERKPLDEAIRIAQKLMDRIIFIAFCEDRGLLPEKCLERAATSLPAFSRVTNPRWHNFLGLFHAVDKGGSVKPFINAFNGGLFAADPEIDDLDLDDEPWTIGFKGFGDFDFSEEVNVEVLGHLFERSITELEKLRVGGLFALKGAVDGANGNGHAAATAKPVKRKGTKAASADDDSPLSKMPKSAQRKRFGIYYTPPAFTGLIVERTVDALVRDRFAALATSHHVDPESREAQDPKKLRAYWTACLECLKSLTICDPACGSGAFLIRAYDAMDAHYKAVVHGLGGAGVPAAELAAIEDAIPDLILSNNLYGVDLSREGVEITQLALWIRSARVGKTLMDLSTHIVHGNSLVTDPAVDPHALDWARAFPRVFGKGKPGGFDCVIGNPPWERVKVQDREFFSLTDPVTAQAVSAADRKKRIAAMPTAAPELHESYLAARDRAQKMLDYARGTNRYPLTGKGDLNLYMLFAELARSIVAPAGMAGLLVPSGIATDDTTKGFFNDLMDRKALVSLYDFENKEGHFEDVHRSFKFTALVFGGGDKQTEQADFVFFARDVDEVAESNRQQHIALTAADMKLLNPNTKTCPIFRTRRDANLTRAIYQRVPILIDENRRQGGNPWGIKFLRMFDQTNDAGHFHTAKVWEKKGYTLRGNIYSTAKKRALPLYEAKMVQAFDHRAASVVVEDDNWVRQGQKAETSLVQHANPEFAVLPRWWVAEDVVEKTMADQPGNKPWFMGFKDITSATNERTMISSFVPRAAITNKFVLMLSDAEPRRQSCLLGNFNSFVFDYVTRQKIGAVTLNFFIVEQLPTLPPDTYDDKCPWSKKETLEHWISERVLKLSCTAEDMLPLAKACDFKGSRGDGVHVWKEQERAELRAELDAAYFILYGIGRADAEYMLSTFTGTGFIAEDQRDDSGRAWERRGQGDMILEAYDHLSGLASAR
ncbi:MAG: N-6 DNA methylase [Phycisphaerales bacterium]|nr:N-6 DNA methylase [Phycisphaerales bacterium]